MWNSLIGTPFRVHCRLRQGGVLSSLLFATHVDELISELRQSGCGLHTASLFTDSILYADDTALLACGCYIYGLQQLLNTHTHPFNGPFSGTTQVSRYQKGKTDLDFTEARDSEWQ